MDRIRTKLSGAAVQGGQKRRESERAGSAGNPRLASAIFPLPGGPVFEIQGTLLLPMEAALSHSDWIYCDKMAKQL